MTIMWFVVFLGPEVHPQSPSRSALRTYGISVVAIVVAIPVGSALMSNVLEKPHAVLVWVVFVVGAHFLPFANAFHLPVFRWLSASLVLTAVIGAVPALANDSALVAGWTGVAAGFVLLVFSLVGPRLTETRSDPVSWVHLLSHRRWCGGQPHPARQLTAQRVSIGHPWPLTVGSAREA